MHANIAQALRLLTAVSVDDIAAAIAEIGEESVVEETRWRVEWANSQIRLLDQAIEIRLLLDTRLPARREEARG
mgnify:CR=1 FL=1